MYRVSEKFSFGKNKARESRPEVPFPHGRIRSVLTISVSHLGGDDKVRLGALAQADDALIPSLDDLTDADLDVEGRTPVAARVELRSLLSRGGALVYRAGVVLYMSPRGSFENQQYKFRSSFSESNKTSCVEADRYLPWKDSSRSEPSGGPRTPSVRRRPRP